MHQIPWLGISQPVQDSLVASGLDTISKFAFCSSYVPGQTNERPFVEAITNALMRDNSRGDCGIAEAPA